jgi:hypothetical protein
MSTMGDLPGRGNGCGPELMKPSLSDVFGRILDPRFRHLHRSGWFRNVDYPGFWEICRAYGLIRHDDDLPTGIVNQSEAGLRPSSSQDSTLRVVLRTCMIFVDSWSAGGVSDPDRCAIKPFAVGASWSSPPSRPDGAMRAVPGYAKNASLGKITRY